MITSEAFKERFIALFLDERPFIVMEPLGYTVSVFYKFRRFDFSVERLSRTLEKDSMDIQP